MNSKFYNKLFKKSGKFDDTEKNKIKSLLGLIEKKIAGRYDILEPIDAGGTGIVIKVKDCGLETLRALKFPRPLVGKESLLTSVIASEIERLIETAHENIVSIYYRNQVKFDGRGWPFYVMEYIDDAKNGKEYILSLQKSDQKAEDKIKSLIKIIQQIVEGLIFVHTHNMVHLDVKLENILVSPDAKAKLSDFGSAKLLIPKKEKIPFVVTKFYAHPILARFAQETSTDPNRMKGKISRSILKKEFDLYALGKNLLRILLDIRGEGFDSSYMPPYERQYLELMACRMLDGLNEDDERCLKDLPKKGYEEIKYREIKDVATDIKKITGEYAIHQAIKELDHHFPETIQITSPGTTSFTGRVANILKLPFFRRLAGISQLGFITQIYPSASHSRLEHVLGTFANVARYCDALWNDPVNPLFKQIMTEKDINLVLLAALCHDIGQYPLAHDFEGAESDIFSHTGVGKSLLTSKIKETVFFKRLMKDEWQVKLEDVLKLLETKVSNPEASFKFRLLHSLIDGPIDADKLDYLIRDSNHLGVPYGKGIDFERLLKCLTIILKSTSFDQASISLGIHEKGRIPAESVAFARYAMFSSVYWHHASRSAKSMLHRAVWEALKIQQKNKKGGSKLKKAFKKEIIQQVRTGFTYQQKDSFANKRDLVKMPQLALSDYQMLIWLQAIS